MTPTEIRVADIMAAPGRALSRDEIGIDTAMAQDAHIDGIDVDDFVAELEAAFGQVVHEIPWLRFSDQRASFRNWGCLLFPLWLAVRLPIKLLGRPIIPPPDPAQYPRLTVAHIARVIDDGAWIEPS